MVRNIMGSNAAAKAATQVTYKTVWVAWPTIENSNAITSVSEIVNKLTV
jgi:nitronate monooxygenase